MSETFNQATAVQPNGLGQWTARQLDGWDINGNANGGVTLAIAARAMAAHVDRPDPLTITGHYLRPVKAGPLEVTTAAVKQGRRMATVTGQLLQGGQVTMALVGTFGDLSTAEGPTVVSGVRPNIVGPDACVGRANPNGFAPGLMSKIDVRIIPEDANFGTENASGNAVMRGWFRLLGDEPLDSFGLLLAVDAFAPAVFNTGLPSGWAPTIELTVHVRRRPVSRWIQAQVCSRYILGGFMEEDVELFDDEGLVAMSRQLAMVPLDAA